MALKNTHAASLISITFSSSYFLSMRISQPHELSLYQRTNFFANYCTFCKIFIIEQPHGKNMSRHKRAEGQDAEIILVDLVKL